MQTYAQVACQQSVEQQKTDTCHMQTMLKLEKKRVFGTQRLGMGSRQIQNRYLFRRLTYS